MIAVVFLRLSLLQCCVTVALSSQACAASARLIDGTSIEVDGETIRISNIETPGIRNAQCEAERRLGMRARKRIRELSRTGSIAIHESELGRHDDEPGRLEATISIDGTDFGERLIEEGFARPRTGEGRGWCR
ncbi:thermonuclease family protein [Rhizobium sp. RU33A]|uniref:thermonuclease family protein n=1 Tax=Rhizobium sp. RU33A TaxID=1907413 RepID=UPI000970A935|nr:thermonuclease family protein [Rhizobium sp. RU33A]